ncbi:MAG: DUF4332 domain-containing protein [Pseudomonadales bacterium]
MDYLIAEIVVCLVLAFVLGCVIGWLLKGSGGKRRVAALEQEIADLKAAAKQNSEPVPAPAAAVAADSDVAVAGGAATAASAVAASVAAPAPAEQPAVVQATSYEVEEVEGISPGYGRRLREIGIDSTVALLDKCQTPEDLAAIAEHCGVEHFAVQKWAYMADLLRIPGVRGPYSELLVFAGVDTVQDLAARKASTLAGELSALNAREERIEEAPSAATLTDWIAAAAQLPVKLAE